MYFKEVRDALVWALADVIDEDEFLVLYEDYRPFSLNDMDSSE